MKKLFIYHFILICLGISSTFAAASGFEKDSIQLSIEKAQGLLKEYKYERALEIAQAASETALFNNDNKNLGFISNILAKIYELNKEDYKAISEYEKGLIYASSPTNDSLKSELYNGLGSILIKNANTRGKGVTYFEKAYRVAKKINDTSRMVQPLLNLSEHDISKNLYKEGYQKLQVARPLITNTSPLLTQMNLNVLLGKYFYIVRRYEKADKFIDTAIALGLRQVKNKDNDTELISTYYKKLSDSYKTKSDIYSKQKEYQQAYNYLSEYHNNMVKATELKKEIELQRATIKFEVGQFKKQIKQNEVEKDERAEEEIKWHISFVLGGVIFLISILFLINVYRNNIQRRKLNRVLMEKNKELKEAKEAAEQVSTLKSQFISTVSHELRTPLYGVIGLTSLLMEHPEEQKRKEYLESLKFSGDYLLALINDVLQLSKIETNEVTLEKVSFDLRTLIQGISDSLRSKQKRNNNKIHIEIDDTIQSALFGDSVRLSQILINLVGNALKFTKNGNIWIQVQRLETIGGAYKLRFSIKDDGIGIPKEKQKSIFESFAQVKNQHQEYEGTGLGLSIVKKLIHLHESEIFIDSTEGEGSTFTFDIVYTLAEEKQQIPSLQNETISVGTSNFHILVVDDNKINQVVTQNILKKKGYTCDTACDGNEAIDKIKSVDFDLVLMDINMPGISGLEATKIVRTFDQYIPIIALTAVEEGEIREQALSVGMNDVIIKPYDTQQFFQTIMKNISNVHSI